MTITFAVVGHNERQTLANALGLALAAANGSSDDVVFVDSASTDGSSDVAGEHGVTTWAAPLGKGAALREAFRRNQREWLVFLDADIHESEHNIADILATTVRTTDAGMVVGDFSDPMPGGVLSNTLGIYEPFINRLFPEVAGRFGGKPLSGFRAVRDGVVTDLAALPNDFGIEAHLNIEVGLGDRPVEVIDIGWYGGRFLYKPGMGLEIGRGILDRAEAHGRLATRQRPAWDRWMDEVADVVATYHGDVAQRDAYRARLDAVRARPLPPSD